MKRTTLQPVSYTLPAYWASYLINGDASGIDDSDKAAADRFHAAHNLPGPVGCSDESWFAHWNDSDNGPAGDVLEYTYLLARDHSFDPLVPSGEVGPFAVALI